METQQLPKGGMTMQSEDLRELLDSTFEELALVLGGAFAMHRINEEAIWQIMKSMDELHSKTVARLEGLEQKESRKPDRSSFQPHPAVEALLQKLRRNS